MFINVRVNGVLAQDMGTSRLRVQVEGVASVTDLLDELRLQYPESAQKLSQAIPIVDGQHLAPTADLADEQEVALLMPVAGG
jgi:molybdopterin converting factor small subunit